MPVRPSLGAAALGALALVFAVAYPAAVARALDLFGVRPVAAAVVGAGLLSFAFAPARAPLPGLGPLPRAALLALPALAALSGAVVWLRLVPAGIQALCGGVFLASLRGGGSVLQDMARRIHPYAPDFIAGYCRKATAVFAALFGLQAVVLAALALAPPPRTGTWALWSSLVIWIPPLAVSLVEWIVRKAWFRYYGPGPVDRLLRRLLPPERTARGRRSLEYVRRMRRELGMPPP